MKAIVQEQFGPPEVLRLADLDRPVPGDGDVLVQVHAAAVNPYDWHMVRGDPRVARLMYSTPHPRTNRDAHATLGPGADQAPVSLTSGGGVQQPAALLVHHFATAQRRL